MFDKFHFLWETKTFFLKFPKSSGFERLEIADVVLHIGPVVQKNNSKIKVETRFVSQSAKGYPAPTPVPDK